MIYLLYSLVVLPWITDTLEKGRFPSSLQEALNEVILSALIAVGVFVFIRQREKIERQGNEIGRMSDTDSLTGLGNVRLLQEALVREIARTRRMDRPLSCLLMNLDDFRMINDRYGHEKGNQVLQVAADTIRKVIRQEMDRAFRYGGDEFMVLLPETETKQALSVAQRLHEAFIALQPPAIPKRALPVSIGLAQLQEDQRAEDLLRRLDRAISQAKSKGKNIIYDAQLIDA